MLPLLGSISCIGKVVGALAWAENFDQRADPSPNFFDDAWLCGAHEVLELGEELLNRLQVGRDRAGTSRRKTGGRCDPGGD